MTQTLDVHDARLSQLDKSSAASAATSGEAAATSRFGTFAITFGIAFAILYTVLEQLNVPLFTYHPAVGKIDFGMQPPRRGEGPPMYWYGWLALSVSGALVLGWVATLVSDRWLQKATVFSCVLAAAWPALFGLAVFVANRVSFDAEFLKSVWLAGIPALAVAAAVSYFTPMQWAQRLWTSWLVVMPIGGLVILGYSLKSFFLR